MWVQAQNVPHEAWHVFMDLNSLLQCVKGRCTTQEECERRDIHSAKVKRLPEQTAYIASFATTYPQVFGATTAETNLDRDPLKLIKITCDWDQHNGEDVLIPFISDSLDDQVGTLQSHFDVALAGCEAAHKLSNALLNDAHSSWQRFVDKVEGFQKLMCTTKFGRHPSNVEVELCWEVSLKLVKCVVEELGKVRSPARSAHALTGHPRVAKFMYAALQAHRVLQEFEKCDYFRHPKFAPILQLHMFDTYVQKSAVTLVTTRLLSLEQDNKRFKNRVEFLCG